MKLKYYLIASAENHYQPWLMTKTAMACFCFSIWVLRLLLPNYIVHSSPGLDNQDLMTRINAERTSRYLPALVTNSKLSAAAAIKSQDMLDRNYFAHVNPDGDYVWPTVEAQGYQPYQSLGENLAIDFFTAEKVVEAWMNSPGHRANVLNERFQDQGMSAIFGEYDEGHDTYVVTNLFGSLIKRVASETTTAQNPSPAPAPAPAQSSPDSKPASPTPQETSTQPDLPKAANDDEPMKMTPFQGSTTDGLLSLKILISIFAGTYALFLAIDSFIIHRAKLKREGIPSSGHALMFFLIALVNAATLWI